MDRDAGGPSMNASSSSSVSPSALRNARAPPVLQINVHYGMGGEDIISSSPSIGASVVNGTRRNQADASTLAATSLPLNSTITSSTAGGAPPSSSLAKPTLDPSCVRCCPVDQWVPEAHVVNCMAPDCTNSFSIFNRKHRCRMCGRVFCASCCSNVIYLSAAVAARGMASGGGGGPDSFGMSAYPGGSGGGNGVTPESAGARNAAMLEAEVSAGPPTPAPVSPTTTANSNGITGSGDGGTVTPMPATTTPSIISSPVTSSLVSCRVCASCSYEVQLVVSTRQDSGEPRRRSRGELKMLQRVLLVNIMTFLPLYDLTSAALVSADFYFVTHDNIIWYQYNMVRWAQEAEVPHLASLKSRASALRTQQRGSVWYNAGAASGGGASAGAGGGKGGAGSNDMFRSVPAIQDATALSEGEAAKRVISLHARYNYTQFLDFARRQEMARCEGISSFSLGARLLLSSPIRVALVGPCGIGKSAAVHAFLGERTTQMVVRPTIGFQRRAVQVRLSGGLTTEVTLHVYDLSGAPRYEELRRFVCRHCHVIALCYDANAKVTLVRAADIMMEMEAVLGPQPVVVCGLLRRSGSRAVPGVMQKDQNGRSPTSSGIGATSVSEARVTALSGKGSTVSAPLPGIIEDRNVTAARVDQPATDIGASGGDAASRFSSSVCVNTNPLEPPPVIGDLASLGVDASKTPIGAPLQHAKPCASTEDVAGSVASHTTPLEATSTEVTVEDAVGISVRGTASIQCHMLHSAPLFEATVQAVLDRLGEGTVATTTSVAEISAELTMHGVEVGSPLSVPSRMASVTNRDSMAAASVTSRGSMAAASALRSSSRRRRTGVSRGMVQELLNLTMQPCALDILLDRK